MSRAQYWLFAVWIIIATCFDESLSWSIPGQTTSTSVGLFSCFFCRRFEEEHNTLRRCRIYLNSEHTLLGRGFIAKVAAPCRCNVIFSRDRNSTRMNTMGEIVVEHSEDSAHELKNWEHKPSANKEMENCGSFIDRIEGRMTLDDLGNTGKSHELLEKGHMLYGCSHYRRRCHIRAPCCNEVFYCRHCHNEAKNSIGVHQNQRHEIPRHQIQAVICSLCGTEQEVQQACINCGVCVGKYFCATCKLFDDDISKKQYHCNGCGICRIGGSENFFHCHKCGCCYSTLLRNSHPCVEGAMHHDCPICFEYLFESRNDVTVLPCGHTIHLSCLEEMRVHYQYTCPLCLKSVCDMSKVWEKFDLEIATTPMPKSYENKMVWILCNDCGKTSQVQYHVVAHKCLNCSSYNTRQTRG